ncbi:MAG: G1 family endopeptidase [Desulfosporosinus sp.]|nr:G1 family endopeptidase [Desulfosporosinus sp.]
MKNTMVNKMHVVSLAVLVGLGASSLVNGVTAPLTAGNKAGANLVLSRNSLHGHVHTPKTQQSQGTATNVNLPVNTQESDNWAGYIDTPSDGNSYTSVSGNWTVPTISVSQQNAAAAQWIGLGGVSSTDLLQMGTIEQIINGQQVTEVFCEQLPSPAQMVMSVPNGSTINASISQASDLTWNLTFTVNGQSQTQTISPVTLDPLYVSGIGTSAEWISEDPSTESDQLYPLADMGTVAYQAALVNGQPLNSTSNNVQPVAMVSSNENVLIAPSVLGADNESFSTSIPITTAVPTTVSTPTTYYPQGFGQTGDPWSHSNIRQGRRFNSRGYQEDNFSW